MWPKYPNFCRPLTCYKKSLTSCNNTFYRLLPLQYIHFLNILKLNPLTVLSQSLHQNNLLSNHLTCSIQAEVSDRWKKLGYYVPKRKQYKIITQKIKKNVSFKIYYETSIQKLPNVFQRTHFIILYKKSQKFYKKILSTYFYHTN